MLQKKLIKLVFFITIHNVHLKKYEVLKFERLFFKFINELEL